MKTLDWYRSTYQDPELDEIVVFDSKVTLPYYLAQYLFHLSGVRSKKKRHVKKAIKRVMYNILTDYLEKQGHLPGKDAK